MRKGGVDEMKDIAQREVTAAMQAKEKEPPWESMC